MANAFSKEEIVAFEDICEGFYDELVLSRNVSKYVKDSQTMERAGDVIWRPVPYIARSFDGMDQTSNFNDQTQLSVPSTLGYEKSSPWIMDAKELRDALQENRLGVAAKQKLASDINVAVTNVAAYQGTVVIARPGEPTGYDDIAECDTAFNELGVDMADRCAGVHSRDYNKMAGNLAARQTMQGKPTTAYEKAYVDYIAGFDLYKMDYGERLTAATATGVTVNGASQYYTPQATSTAVTGERQNVDNRYQNLDVTVTSGTIKVGDCFTLADVNSVHMITKNVTDQLKTFRVTGIVSGAGGTGTIQISPPIISAEGATQAEEQYKNVSATPANGAVVTFLNIADSYMNPFFHKDAIELIPGSYAVPSDSGAAVMRATTENGIEIVMQKWYDINTMKTKFRLDTLFGVVNKQPEMSGIELFRQT